MSPPPQGKGWYLNVQLPRWGSVFQKGIQFAVSRSDSLKKNTAKNGKTWFQLLTLRNCPSPECGPADLCPLSAQIRRSLFTYLLSLPVHAGPGSFRVPFLAAPSTHSCQAVHISYSRNVPLTTALSISQGHHQQRIPESCAIREKKQTEGGGGLASKLRAHRPWRSRFSKANARGFCSPAHGRASQPLQPGDVNLTHAKSSTRLHTVQQ